MKWKNKTKIWLSLLALQGLVLRLWPMAHNVSARPLTMSAAAAFTHWSSRTVAAIRKQPLEFWKKQKQYKLSTCAGISCPQIPFCICGPNIYMIFWSRQYNVIICMTICKKHFNISWIWFKHLSDTEPNGVLCKEKFTAPSHPTGRCWCQSQIGVRINNTKQK